MNEKQDTRNLPSPIQLNYHAPSAERRGRRWIILYLCGLGVVVGFGLPTVLFYYPITPLLHSDAEYYPAIGVIVAAVVLYTLGFWWYRWRR